MGRTRVLAALLVLATLAGCSNEDPSNFSVTSENAAATLLQGSTGAITLTVARTNFEKDIDLELEGTVPDGVTFIFSQDPIPAGQPTVTLTFQVAAAATPGTSNFTVKATAEGSPEQTIPVTLTVNLRGSHTLALETSAMTVAQGGGGSTTLLVTRTNSNAGNVTLALSSPPAGITATFGQSPTTSSSTAINLSVAGTVAPGAYQVTVSSSQPGVTPNPTTILTVNVEAPKPTTSTTISFCAEGTPNWFAYQNEGFNWKQQQPSGNTFTFQGTDKLGIAYTIVAGNASLVSVIYATRTELVAASNEMDCIGSRNLTGTTANVSASQIALVAMGPRLDEAAGNAFSLDFIPTRPLDLVATRGQLASGLLTPDRMIIRRGLTTASGALPVLDFQSGESFAPVLNTTTIVGLGTDLLYVQNDFWGNTASYGPIFSALPTNSSVTTYSVPAAAILPGDIHQLYVDTFEPTAATARSVFTFFQTPGNRTVTLPPTLTSPTISVASRAPGVRFRGQLESQAEYAVLVRFRYGQSSKENRVHMTAGYAGSLPSTWNVTFPDLTSANGFDTAWLLTTGAVAYNVEGFSSRADLVLGGQPVAGDVINIGYREGAVNVTASLVQRSNTRTPWPRRPGMMTAAPQYLRR